MKEKGMSKQPENPWICAYTLFLSIIIISQPLYIGNHISLSLLQNGMTPLMTASFNGHVKVVRVLIRSQAQLNTQDGV